MNFVAALCPNCSANIQVDENANKCFCQYCGTQIIVDEAVQKIQGTVKLDLTKQIENYLIRANEFFSMKRYEDAESYYNKVLDIDATNSEARRGLLLVEETHITPNLYIERGKIRPSGEGKTYLYINGKKNDADLDNYVKLTLPVGTYEIVFKRAALSSKPISLTIKNKYDNYTVRFTPKLLSINVEII